MNHLSEETIHQLAMSPLYVLYLVTSAYVLPEQISGRHIVRTVEYGLPNPEPFSGQIFELLRSHLHEFHAEFVSENAPIAQEELRAELVAVGQALDRLAGPQELGDSFKRSLIACARFVAAGGPFRKKVDHPGMQGQVAWLAHLLA